MTGGSGLGYGPAADDAGGRRPSGSGLGWDPDAAADGGGELDRLLSQARRKLEAGDHQAAMALLNKAEPLGRENAEIRLLQAECLLARRQPRRALPKIEIAGSLATDPVVRRRIEAVKSTCLADMANEGLERARGCVRAGDLVGAQEILRQHDRLYQGNEHVKDVIAYAAGGRFPDPARLRRLLGWLTAEELEAAENALDAGRFEDALSACRAAHRIDSRGAQAAMLRARAVLGLYGQLLAENPRQSLETLRNYLTEARRWAEAAGADPVLRPFRDWLVAEVDARLRTLDDLAHQIEADLQERRRQAEPVRRLVDRYNGLVRDYSDRYLTREQRDSVHASLASLLAEARHLRGKLPSDSPAARALASLEEKIVHALGRF